MGLIIKFERIKVNLIKRRFDLIFFKAEVHENKRELNYERERESKVPTSPQFAQQWLTIFNSRNS
jgi:hypothetical protein